MSISQEKLVDIIVTSYENSFKGIDLIDDRLRKSLNLKFQKYQKDPFFEKIPAYMESRRKTYLGFKDPMLLEVLQNYAKDIIEYEQECLLHLKFLIKNYNNVFRNNLEALRCLRNSLMCTYCRVISRLMKGYGNHGIDGIYYEHLGGPYIPSQINTMLENPKGFPEHYDPKFGLEFQRIPYYPPHSDFPGQNRYVKRKPRYQTLSAQEIQEKEAKKAKEIQRAEEIQKRVNDELIAKQDTLIVLLNMALVKMDHQQSVATQETKKEQEQLAQSTAPIQPQAREAAVKPLTTQHDQKERTKSS